MGIKDYIKFVIFLAIIVLAIVGFIYNYSQDSNTTPDECAPDYMTGDCNF